MRFGSPDPLIMRVTRAEPPVTVQWHVIGYAPLPDWAGTTIRFDLSPTASGGTELRFRHYGLRADLDCYDMCRAGWDHFLPSLRGYAESGHGRVHGAPRTIEVTADLPTDPDTVFEYLTDPTRYTHWMGDTAVAATDLELNRPHRLAFTWGLTDPATRVDITLSPTTTGTTLTLWHHDLPDELRSAHRTAWTTHLARLTRVLTESQARNLFG
ncbi:SRPBCC family protein [Nocardia concava]|uniref:SRPBCC family protein n=1 Tax=Nocardia concava TaxID=257281 RepID=UPI0002D6F740|nr:SRPBCC family protein [Nocardia concava]